MFIISGAQIASFRIKHNPTARVHRGHDPLVGRRVLRQHAYVAHFLSFSSCRARRLARCCYICQERLAAHLWAVRPLTSYYTPTAAPRCLHTSVAPHWSASGRKSGASTPRLVGCRISHPKRPAEPSISLPICGRRDNGLARTPHEGKISFYTTKCRRSEPWAAYRSQRRFWTTSKLYEKCEENS